MKITLEELTLNIVDGVHGDCEPAEDSGYYFISVKDMNDNCIEYEGARQISFSAFNDAHKRTRLEVGDVLFANTGHTIGKMLNANHDTLKIGQTTFQKSIALLKPNPDLVTSDYFFYLIKSVRDGLRNAAVGSSQKNLLLRDIRAFPVDILQDKKRQINAINPLLLLDQKITINNAINTQLESTAKLIYNYYFTQFDFPNEHGKPYRASGGEMIYNPQLHRPIPKGWRVEKLTNSSLCTLLGSGIDTFEGNKIYLATADVDENKIVSNGTMITYHDRVSRANMQPRLNSVWFAKMKDTVKHILIDDSSEYLITDYIFSTGFAGLQCSPSAAYYLWNYIRGDYFEDQKNLLATGATQQAINDDDLNNFHIVVPDESSLKQFNNLVAPSYKLISNLTIQNKELAAIRDFLLPLLMNGQVTIKAK